jgi:5-methylcytosine-specific restriction protein A
LRTIPARAYGKEWRKATALYRRQHPLCVFCERKGIWSATYAIDHIVPHKGDPVLFWSEGNWQPLCQRCHNRTKKNLEMRGYDPHAIGVDGYPLDPNHPAIKRRD